MEKQILYQIFQNLFKKKEMKMFFFFILFLNLFKKKRNENDQSLLLFVYLYLIFYLLKWKYFIKPTEIWQRGIYC